MPELPFSQALTANQVGFNPISSANWQFDRVPMAWPLGALVTLLDRATTTGVRRTVFAGSDQIVKRSPVQGGGTAGVTPAPLNTPAFQFFAAPDDKITIEYDEVSGGTPTVDGWISIEPRVG